MKLVNMKLRIESIVNDMEEYGIPVKEATSSKTILEENKLGSLSFWVGTEIEYNEIINKNDFTLYLVTA